MGRLIKVSFRGIENFEVDEETPIKEIADKVSTYYKFPIIVGKIDNEIVGLDTPITRRCNLDFFDRSNSIGNNVYTNSVSMMMVVAVRRLYGKNANVIIQNSIDNGVCCEIKLDGLVLDKTLVKQIEDEMDKIVKEGLSFTSINVRRLDAIKYFNKEKEYDKANVLKYITDSYVTLSRLDDYYDYYFTSLAYNTKDIPDYKLTYVKDNNFVLSVPNTYNPEITENYKHVPIVFDTFRDYNKWVNSIGINVASDLNKFISEGKVKDVIRLAELHYEAQLLNIANDIYEKRNNIKMVLLAGPSSSGKTTSAKKLSYYLRTLGFNTITLSTDDYFKEREETPKDANGEYDFECLEALDLKLFNKQMSKLLKGDKVLVPEYNFLTGKKEYKNHWLQMNDKDIIVIEGLHCLNEELTSSIDRKEKYKIFIGPFTQLNIDNHIRIHTSDTRRLRRIIRDNRTRGYGASATLAMWHKIKEGEFKYIYPYERDANAIINSSLVYELGVLKTYAEPLLFSVKEDEEVYPEALRLINFLRNILPIPSDDIPRDSVLREFIGGSGFYND